MKRLILIPLFILACAHEPKQATPSSSAAAIEQKAVETTKAALITEVSFKKGSSELTPGAKQKLESLINEAKAKGKIDDVKVIAWADLHYPSPEKKVLSKQQRDLASKRSQEVQKYVKNFSDTYVDVDTYNMAERPNTFEKWFSTSDYKIKKSLEEAGLPTTGDGSLRLPDKRSTAMVLVVLE